MELSDTHLALQRNDYLLQAGEIDERLYLVESGSLRIYFLDHSEEQTVRLAYRGNIVLALDSFLTGKASQYFIQALKKTKVHIIPKHRMDALFLSDEFRQWWSGVLEGLVVQQLERERDLLTASPKERYLRVLERSPALFQEIPRRHIANYLRMTPETLSRVQKS